MDNLAELLQKVEKPVLNDRKKGLMKQRLFQKMTGRPRPEMSIFDFLKEAVRNIGLSMEQKVMLKEKVFALVENHVQKRFFWSNLFVFNKKLVSLALVVALFFTVTSFLNINTSVVWADNFTKLDYFQGPVLVERDGQFRPAYLGMKIMEKDKIVTADGAQAVINYFDDSVTRLAGDTSVVVNSLQRGGGGNSYVEVSLLDGNLWSKVIGLVGEDSSFVVESKDVYAASKRAAFNVEADDERLQIKVFNHVVDVKSAGGQEKVGKWKKIVVEAGTQKISNVRALAAEEKNDEWVQKNLESDKEYADQVEQKALVAKMEAVGMESVDEELPAGNSLRENALLFLTFDDVKQKKTELDLAEKMFLAAQVKLNDPDMNEDEKKQAEVAVGAFADAGEEINVLIKDVATKDENYALSLRKYLDEKISNHKKELNVILPDSPLYQMKTIINEMEMSAVDGNVEIAELKVEQAAERFADVEDMIDSAETNLVNEVIEQYTEEVTLAAEAVDAVEETAVKKQLELEVNGLLEAIATVSGQDEAVAMAAGETGVADEGDATAVSDAVGANVGDDDLQLHDGPFGVTIQGDKPLPPILDF
ncbi:FecR domain-containing protein [Candidatus Peregrinibacteria bacterium]|nr:FecR domain-containing protein [Candidatus Peregrinibacteria bacterium]